MSSPTTKNQNLSHISSMRRGLLPALLLLLHSQLAASFSPQALLPAANPRPQNHPAMSAQEPESEEEAAAAIKTPSKRATKKAAERAKKTMMAEAGARRCAVGDLLLLPDLI
jgi:hypothetical protein